jgi:S-DNA-T family DNA segregation ATPase FtsK/SpoIIIE
MRWQWTIDDGVRSPYEVVVEAEPDVSIEVPAASIGLAPHSISAIASDEAAVAASAPVSGQVLPLRRLPVRVGGLSLRFRAGPLSGQSVPLARSSARLGRGSDNDVVIADPSVSHTHLQVTMDGDDIRIAPADGARPVRVNGRALETSGRVIGASDLIEFGSSVVSIGVLDLPQADVTRESSGGLAFNRPSRIRPRRAENRVQLAGERPEPPASAPLPWAMAAVPVGLGVTMALVAHEPSMLMMSAASPAMVLTSYRAQRKAASKRGASTLAKWRRDTEAAGQRLVEITDEERSEAWQSSPDPATVREICVGRASLLWERRISDADALWVRLGAAELPVPVKIDGQSSEGGPVEPYMSPTPVGVDLLSSGVLGIAGPEQRIRWLGRSLVLQLAALRSPRDLGMVLLCDQLAETSWRWVRWLPHLQSDVSGAPFVQIGNTETTRASRVIELAKEIEARQDVLTKNRDVRFARQIVVVLDGARAFRTLQGMTAILRDGPSVGEYAVCLDEIRSRLPEEASAELLIDEADASLGELRVAGEASVLRVLIDGVSADVADECARSISPLLHVGGDGDASSLPASVRFADLANIDPDDPDRLAQSWRVGGRTASALVGAGIDGPFTIDLRLDGPHALVAGTTGAGKSEFLQTLVVSLALGNRPDALNFVLVDYKGASAFSDCERLPHTVGMVTNLDNRETERALESLDAELERRERVLQRMGAKDIDDAWDRDPATAAASGLAKLVLVIDEFAELVNELPDFVKGLIRIARVGRSLGVHLILATQRPTGVVSAEMQANVGLRVALRMADKENSTEVLGSPESAYITTSTPGRGFVRRGADATPIGFQTARVAGRRPGRHALISPAPKTKPVGWAELGEPLKFPLVPSGATDPNATDLHALVGLVQAASERLQITPSSRPWLPPLADLITIDDLAAKVGRSSREEGLLLGLLDVPAQQAQTALRSRPTHDSHLMIAGSSRSGRSTVLRSLIAGLAQTYAPDDVHLYCLDFGGSALLPARGLPHCGAVITGIETDRAVRLFARLIQEVMRRQHILARHGYGDITEQRDHASRRSEALPHIVVLLDRWEGLLSAYPLEEMQDLRDKVIKILREGPAVGLSVIITGDRALLTDRIAAFIETRYTLRMSDREDFRLAGIRLSSLPEKIPPGRAYSGDPTEEVQFAVLAADTTGKGQTTALRRIVDDLTTSSVESQATRPFRLDVLPAAITLDEATKLPVATRTVPNALSMLVGVGGDNLSQYQIDFTAGPGFLFAGQRQTGRSTALAVTATFMHRATVPVLVVAPKESPASAAARHLDAELVTGMDSTAAARVQQWVDDHQPCAVLVDDADMVHGTDVDDTLIDLVRSRPTGSFALIVASPVDDIGALLRGVAVEAKRTKQGVLLSPNSSLDGNALGTGVPRSLLGRSPAGRAIMLVAGSWMPVQLPLPDVEVTA